MSEAELRVIRPGDTVLVRLPGGAPPEWVERFAKELKERLPDVEICVLAGVDGIDVYRPNDTARAMPEAGVTAEQIERAVAAGEGGPG